MQPSRPEALAALRIVVAGSVALLSLQLTPNRYANLPEAFHDPAWGLGPAILTGAQHDWLVWSAWTVLLAACATLAIGWRSRTSALLVAVTGTFVLGIPMQYGIVSARHHLIWFAVILAFSPCGDAWAVDATARREPSVAYGFPLRCVWLIYGTMYLFPGLSKVVAGADWPGAFYWQIKARQWESGTDLPLLALPHGIATLAGLSLVVFELSFCVLVFTRWRRWAVAAGLFFHLMAALTCSIWFWHFAVGYVVFWGASIGRRDATLPRRSVIGPAVVVVAAFVGGLSFVMNGWPVGSYPRFDDVMGRHLVQVQITTIDGRELDPAVVAPWTEFRRLNSIIRSAVDRDPQAAADAFGNMIGEPVRVYYATRDLGEDGAVIGRHLLATSDVSGSRPPP